MCELSLKSSYANKPRGFSIRTETVHQLLRRIEYTFKYLSSINVYVYVNEQINLLFNTIL